MENASNIEEVFDLNKLSIVTVNGDNFLRCGFFQSTSKVNDTTLLQQIGNSFRVEHEVPNFPIVYFTVKGIEYDVKILVYDIDNITTKRKVEILDSIVLNINIRLRYKDI